MFGSDWDSHHRITVVAAIVAAGCGVAGLVLGIVNATSQTSFDTRQLDIAVTPLIAAAPCRVNDPVFVDVTNTGFQAAGIQRVGFLEDNGEVNGELPVKVSHRPGPKSAFVLRPVPPDPGYVDIALNAGGSHEFVYSLGDLIAHHVISVVVYDQSGKTHTSDVRSVLAAVPADGPGCPSDLRL